MLLLVFVCHVSAQNKVTIDADLDIENDIVTIVQELIFHNQTDTVLNEIYFFDWNNSFSSKTTPLAKSFAENFTLNFHFEKDEARGKTTILSIRDSIFDLKWNREKAADILKVVLSKPLNPDEKIKLSINYSIKVPDAKFTRFGVTRNKEYFLKHWLILPAIYQNGWQVYSNKNIDDLYILPTDFELRISTPASHSVTSDLDVISISKNEISNEFSLSGKNRLDVTLYIEPQNTFKTVITDNLTLVTNIHNPRLSPPLRAVFIERIISFLNQNLGAYPNQRMVVSDPEYRRQPVYGLNLLPSFLSPFPDGFEYDLAMLKTISKQYLNNSLVMHPRKDYWLQDALHIYLMMNYVDTFYPEMKLGGSFSDWWLLQWSEAAKMEFNDQYQFLYMNIARQHLNQALTTERDSLIKYNVNIANAYYGASGLKYLESYMGKYPLEVAIKAFYEQNKLQMVTTPDFEKFLSDKTDKNISWFVDSYAKSKHSIDFDILKVRQKEDSVQVKIRNKNNQELPVSVYGLNKDQIIYKTWTAPFQDSINITLPGAQITRVALNYDGIIPEINKRNNFKSINGLLNKPIRFELFRDVENPHYNQLYFIPIFEYNLYDGISLGIDAHNKNLLNKNLEYSISPLYGLRSETLIGGGSISYKHYPKDEGKLFLIRYGFSGKYFSYDYNRFYRRYSPFITFTFRPKNLRLNERQYINLRTVSVHRDKNENQKNPNYDVFNFQYVYADQNLIDYFRSVVDYQISSKFSKLSFQLEYRKLFLSNRQIDLRLFSGIFLFNDSRQNDHFFSFALDRPSDYMFDYKYYGRSETRGLFSQQLIMAEGGFKSKLDPGFSDHWITAVNASTNIWRWIFVYGDAALVNNHQTGTKAVFDSGIRLSLLADYFEVFFPMYSSIGFEPGMPDYEQRIRFIITLSPDTLFRLFSRRWY